MFHLQFFPLFNNELSVKGLKYHLDFFISLLRHSNELHIVLFEVLCYVLGIFKGGEHHIVYQLINAISHRFESMLKDLLKFYYYIVKYLVLWDVIQNSFCICCYLRISWGFFLKGKHLLYYSISEEHLALVLIEDARYQYLHLLPVFIVHLNVLGFVLLW